MTLLYADYDYYTNEYNGSEIPSENYPKYAVKARVYLDYVTMGKIGTSVPECVKMASCAISELYFRNEDSSGISSEKSDGYSVAYDKSSTLDSLILNTAVEYLANSGLLYRALGR